MVARIREEGGRMEHGRLHGPEGQSSDDLRYVRHEKLPPCRNSSSDYNVIVYIDIVDSFQQGSFEETLP